MAHRFSAVHLLGAVSIICIMSSLHAQPANWDARWIAPPGVGSTDYGVYCFRNTFTIATVPSSFAIQVSADNRYRLYVNGEPVGFGPARSDVAHWVYDTYDIADMLQSGENILAAEVWNFSDDMPLAQHSLRTGFILQAGPGAPETVNTNQSNWKVIKNPAYSAVPIGVNDDNLLGFFYVAGPCDNVNGANYPWGWQELPFNDNTWQTPIEISRTQASWDLVPRTIPMMEERYLPILSIARASGITPGNQLDFSRPLVIPANTDVSILLDQTHLTMAHPELIVSKGAQSSIKLTYAETLFDARFDKGNRDQVDGKTIYGYYDIFRPDGGDRRLFRPLWVRTYRYLQLDITTGAEPLEIDSLYGVFTAYPFEEKASFYSSNEQLNQVWDIGWRTMRLCAGETYYDCPYYEQLQYVRDTRFQCLVSVVVSGDDLLMQNAISQFDYSINSDGLTLSRYPSNQGQVIPGFSLSWIDMMHDFSMLRNDKSFLTRFIPGIQSVLDWFESKIDNTGMLTDLENWDFVDWSDGFLKWGEPQTDRYGHSSVHSLSYVYTLQRAAALFDNLGRGSDADGYRTLAQSVKTAVYNRCYDSSKKLFAQTPDKKLFSQHANILAVLTDAVPQNQQRALMVKVLDDNTLIQTSLNFRPYLFRALNKTGMGNLFIEQLQDWFDLIDRGLTTFPENKELTRSDCHANNSPNYEMLATICGIEPGSPGFTTVKIKPHLASLDTVYGKMPHYKGDIEVAFGRLSDNTFHGSIDLPLDLTGTLIWSDTEIPLSGGHNDLPELSPINHPGLRGEVSLPLFKIHSHPARSIFALTIPEKAVPIIKIYTPAGRLVTSITAQKPGKGTTSLVWNHSNLPGGTYIVRIYTEEYINAAKVVIR
ncbi:MAG: Bacterial alpha-L-rhamnosidase [Chitinivibrionales bacterium]|nr:Bacterial alpha-L-rhamnosidase [Chitinivibrionales bacterium]